MKIFPAVSINKKCHNHQQFLASKCEWGLPKFRSSRCCHSPKWLLRSKGNARSSHLPLPKVNKETDLVPDSWGSREGNGTPLQYSCLENPMDRGARWSALHGVAKSLVVCTSWWSALHFHSLEKEMAPHSSVLAWRIPGTGKPGGLPSMGLHRVGNDWSDLAAAAADEVHERKEFSEPRGLHLPIHRMLNSLAWFLTFDVQTACSLCCELAYGLSQSYWDAVSWVQSPKYSTK